ncbi:hypothetical protein GCM10028781_02480 [Nostocoides australiense]
MYPDPSRDVARHARNIGGDVRITAVQSTSLKKSVRCVAEQPARWGAAAGFSDMIRAALDKLDALQKCAENPTNPVLAGSCTTTRSPY